MGRGMLSKSLIQFSVDGWGCVPSLLFDLRQNYGGSNVDTGNLLQKSHAGTAVLCAPKPAVGYGQPMPPPETPGHSQASLGQSLGVTAPFSWVLVHKVLFVPCKSLFPSPG